jgi:hypothetical protein
VESNENEHAQDSNPSGWKPEHTAGWEARRYKRCGSGAFCD